MQSSLKKTLYVGLAAMSLGAAANFATPAQAASHVTVSSKAALGAKAQNVSLTGTNAIYTKPGTVKGAKVVASKAKVQELAASKKSADYFRAYYTATTSKGSVYYKVVSMNGKYRGYIYGGKAQGMFAGGVKTANTVTAAELPVRTSGFYLKDAKKNTLWTAPKYTQYKGAKKVNMYGVSTTDTFKVSKAETKTREGSLYYYVTSEQHPSVSGWIFAGKGYNAAAKPSDQDLGGLALAPSDATATNDNSVKIAYRDGSKIVGTSTFITAATNTHAGDSVKAGNDKNAAKVVFKDFVSNTKPAGYIFKDNATDVAKVLANATFGNTVYLDVVAAATSKIQLVVDKVEPTNAISVSSALKAGTKLSAKDLSIVLSKTDLLSGPAKTSINKDRLGEISKELVKNNKALANEGETAVKPTTKAATSETTAKPGDSAQQTPAKDQQNGISGSKTYYDAKGDAYHYVFFYEGENFANDNRLAQFGDTLKASFKATLVKGAAKVTSSNSSWVA